MFFFFALSNAISLASVELKQGSTKRATDLRDVGKTILFFNKIYSNLTKSLYEGGKCRLIVVKIPSLRQQWSNSGKNLTTNKVQTLLEYSIFIIFKYESLVFTWSHVDNVGFLVGELNSINTQKILIKRGYVTVPLLSFRQNFVGEERWIYTSTLRVLVYIHNFSPPLRGIVV